MPIPTELVGSLPRPMKLQDAYQAYDDGKIDFAALQAEQDKAAEDSIRRLEQTGETYVTDGGVTIATPLNIPSSMAEHASQLYGRNVLSLLELMMGENGALQLDFEDEVIAGACITRGGEIVHARAKEVAG